MAAAQDVPPGVRPGPAGCASLSDFESQERADPDPGRG